MKRSWFQLYNPSHRAELLRLFEGARKFELESTTPDPDRTVPCVGEDEDEEEEETSLPLPPIVGDEDDGAEAESMGMGMGRDGLGLVCTTCDVTFGDLEEQRQHFRLDWHRYNLKRKVHGQRTVTENEFDEIMGKYVIVHCPMPIVILFRIYLKHFARP